MHDELEQEYEEKVTQGHTHAHNVPLDCAFCKGTGVDPNTMKDINHKLCPVCGGKGLSKFTGHMVDTCKPCLRCGASGREPGSEPLKPCTSCGGYGVKAS
jgi:DnaJ-class molecular chaperone